MEVAITAMDFNFTPYGTAPSTPKRSGEYYFSAPTSPKHLSQFYRDYDDFSPTSSVSSIPFGWEERPGTPKSPNRNAGRGDDFAFDVGNSRSEKATIPAEELFDGGKIRQLKPPPRMGMGPAVSPRSPVRRMKELDPFETAVENTIKDDPSRGRRERESTKTRRGVRSQSPYRVSKYPWEEEEVEEESSSCNAVTTSPKATTSISSKGSSWKWRLRDFFLFRSASEGQGRAKYTRLFKKREEDGKHSSFRSMDGLNSGCGPVKKESGSAHEYYKVNKAISEDLKKRSFLPYKQGILGRLAFNPIANGFGFSRK